MSNCLWSPWTYGAIPGFPVPHPLLQFAQTHLDLVSDAIQPSHPLSSPSPLLSIFPSIRVFSNEPGFQNRWPKCWSFSISPSNEYSGLIFLKINWFDLAVQGILNILLQHHCSNASILWHSPSFTVQLSRAYRTSGKTIALTIWTFASKVMTVLFNILFRFVIAFVPSSKHLLISWLQ